jgi:hypothetical protein
MNLDKASAGNTNAPLAPPEWTMQPHQEGNLYTAELKRAGVTMCRLSVAHGEDGDAKAATAALADKARFWIHDYLGRQAGGS